MPQIHSSCSDCGRDLNAADFLWDDKSLRCYQCQHPKLLSSVRHKGLKNTRASVLVFMTIAAGFGFVLIAGLIVAANKGGKSNAVKRLDDFPTEGRSPAIGRGTNASAEGHFDVGVPPNGNGEVRPPSGRPFTVSPKLIAKFDADKKLWPYNPISSMAFSMDSKVLNFVEITKTVTSRSRQFHLRQWHIGRRRELPKKKLPNEGAISPNGKYLVKLYSFGRSYVWNVAKGTKVADIGDLRTGNILPTRFSVDSSTFFVHQGRPKYGVSIWDAATAKKKGEIEIDSEKNPRIEAFSIAPDGRAVAFHILGEATLDLFDVASGKRRPLQGNMKYKLRRCNSQFTADGKRLAVAYEQGIKIFDVTTGKDLCCLQQREKDNAKHFSSLAISGDGSIAAGVREGNRFRKTDKGNVIVIFDVANRAEVHRFTAPTGELWTMKISPDGRYLAAKEMRGLSICLWELKITKR